jgi:predicted ferric reductase
MSSNTKKVIFYALWFILILVGPITVVKTTPLSLALASQSTLLNFLQRIVGTTAFAMLATQIMLGSFMKTWTEKLGAWVFKFHVFEGALAYSLIILHPLLFVLVNYTTKGAFDPFYVYTDLCVLCSNKREFFYNFGRVAFWLVTIAVTAAKFRTSPYLRVHWRKFHVLNYLAFFAIAYHSWNVGTDTHMFPFVYLFWVALVLVTTSLVLRVRRLWA